MLVISSEAVVGCGHSCPRADTLRPAALSCDTGALRRRQAGFSQKERRAALFIHLAHSIRFGPKPGSQCSHPPGSGGLTGKYADNNRNKRGLDYTLNCALDTMGGGSSDIIKWPAPALLGTVTVSSLDTHFISPPAKQDESWWERP